MIDAKNQQTILEDTHSNKYALYITELT